MSLSKWAAIVYGRTYEVDFRFITVPEDFTEQDKIWAERYILGSTRSPEKLTGNPRWLLFKNEAHCVVGVTCRVKELMQNTSNEFIEDIGDKSDEPIENRTKDDQDRPLYIFVGYVAQLIQGVSIQIPSMNLDLFRRIYQEYVAPSNIWFVKDHQKASRIPVNSQYEIEFQDMEIATIDVDKSKRFNFNQSNKLINLWTNSEAELLWGAASQASYLMSLCLGFSLQKDAIESSFLNATAQDVKEVCTQTKEKPKKTPSPESEQYSPTIVDYPDLSDSRMTSKIPEKMPRDSQFSETYQKNPESVNPLSELGEKITNTSKQMLKEGVENWENVRQTIFYISGKAIDIPGKAIEQLINPETSEDYVQQIRENNDWEEYDNWEQQLDRSEERKESKQRGGGFNERKKTQNTIQDQSTQNFGFREKEKQDDQDDWFP